MTVLLGDLWELGDCLEVLGGRLAIGTAAEPAKSSPSLNSISFAVVEVCIGVRGRFLSFFLSGVTPEGLARHTAPFAPFGCDLRHLRGLRASNPIFSFTAVAAVVADFESANKEDGGPSAFRLCLDFSPDSTEAFFELFFVILLARVGFCSTEGGKTAGETEALVSGI